MSIKLPWLTVAALSLCLSYFPKANAGAQEVRENDVQVKPLHILTRENLLTAAEVGIDVAILVDPVALGGLAVAKTAKKTVDMAKVTLDESIEAVEFRNHTVESHLLVVNKEAEKLEALKKRDGNLSSPDAQIILKDLKKGHFSQDNEYMFLAKSVVSGRMLYGVASHYYIDKWMKKFFGETLAKRWQPGNRAELMWIGKRSYVRTYTNIPWRYLKVLGEASRKFTTAIKVALLKKIGKQIGKYVFQSTLDGVVDSILAANPSIPSAAIVLRMNIATQPALMMPLVRAAAAVPAAPAIAPVAALPAAVLTQADPVVSAASVQNQIIQPYTVNSGTYGSHHEQQEQVEHPTRQGPTLPGNLGSWNGAGSSLYGRY